MEILIAEDNTVSRNLLRSLLTKQGFAVTAVEDGLKAWEALQNGQAPRLAILDWMMPGIDGVEIVKELRRTENGSYTYAILLTAKCQDEDIVTGLDAGADDYLVKPFKAKELYARVRVGIRMVQLQERLNANILKLESALREVKTLRGMLPICSYCKRIRKDENYWQQVESYVSEHTEVQFSHGICPECYKEHVLPQLESIE